MNSISVADNYNIPSLSIMSTVAVGAKMRKSLMPPPEMIRPKNRSVLSTRLSLLIGISIVVRVDPPVNMIGNALA